MALSKLMRISILCACSATPAVGFSTLPPSNVALASLPSTAATTTELHLSDGPSPPRRARRSSSDRPRRPPPNRSRSSGTATRTPTTANGERKRAPHQFDHTKADARPFLDDSATFVKEQSPNEDAPCFIFPEDENDSSTKTEIPEGSHIVSMSLDDLFPNLDFSEKFCSTTTFRDNVRSAMREDIFDSTPAYAGMSEKARKMLLLPDSSLQGSWNCQKKGDAEEDGTSDDDGDNNSLRMVKLTQVLKEYLGENSPTGDEFLETIGNLCGSGRTTHWIDIVGITDRKISHSWHQDTGRSKGGDTKTALLGFPKEDNYDGVGVFSHAVKLKYERVAEEDHPANEPVLYPGLVIPEEYVVRPRFAKGHEIILFRDIDSIHSAPDVAYRASVMRFM
mmetsp:Transcript_23527/g.49777  ORF Transcript_23527/g.49777 Transcript_23527/m.49777 type:complete len:393 (-) Transcript_23527:70-1248(-)